MVVRKVAGGLEVLAPAKLNLFFEILAKRSDGFHEIETLMVPIDLFDSLSFRDDPSGQVQLACSWTPGLRKQLPGAGIGRRQQVADLEELPEGHDNIVMRAVELLRDRAGVRSGASLRLAKRIPSAAGLGGGSSDAAAALVAANVGWKLGWSREQLSRLAAELGSDVPFFLGLGPALCRGRGEQIEPLAGFRSLDFVVVCPPEGLSTAAVYNNCRPAASCRRVDPLIEALRQGDTRRIGRCIYNALEPVANRMSPWIGRVKEEFARMDCVGTQMSGSGTSYFGICPNARHARRLAEWLRSRGVGRVFSGRSL